MDSVDRPSVETLLEDAADDEVRRSPHLSLAFGRSLVLNGQVDVALPWLLRAQSAGGPAIAARAAWEIGCVHLERGELPAAELVARAGSTRRGRDAADVAHLEALVAEQRGDAARAEARYRYAIEHWTEALSAYTRVAAIRNLASSITHRDPREAASLARLGLAVIAADDLDPRTRPAIRNILCYALIASGELAQAQREGEGALDDARSIGARRFASYARFNLAIAHELQGGLEQAGSLLCQLRAELAPTDELRGWCAIRLAWISLIRGDAEGSMSAIADSIGPAPKPVFRETLLALEGVQASIEGSLPRKAAVLLHTALKGYESRSDLVTAFVLYLWLALAYDACERRSDAARALEKALSLGQRQGVRCSPNFWHPALVDNAVRVAPTRLRSYAGSLIRPAFQVSAPPRERPRVVVDPDGEISVDGETVAAPAWRRRRTGSRILRRLFTYLVRQHPRPVSREDIVDLFWPESDGDKAMSNLYSALNDLRHLLADIPGLDVQLADTGYRLRTATNVSLSGTSSGQNRAPTRLISPN